MSTQKYIENHLPKDESVDKMLEEWDIVKCAICKHKLSLLEAKTVIIDGREFFVHKTGRCSHNG